MNIGSDKSLIEDEFHQAARRIVQRSAGPLPRVKNIYEAPAVKQPVYPRVNPTLANNVTSGRQKLAWERQCRICRHEHQLTRHHLIPHSWFLRRRMEIKVLRNANANIVPLCEQCHRVVDSGRDPVSRLQKRSSLRGALYPNEIAFILQVMGQAWFDREYPKDP